MSLERFCRPVVTTHVDEPVAAAAKKLRDQRVGCLIVDRDGRPFGILTDRDLAIRVIADGLDPLTARVGDVATIDPIVVRESEGIATAARRMREHGIRRLPVVDDRGRTKGIVSADDLVRMIGGELGDLAGGLEASTDATDSR